MRFVCDNCRAQYMISDEKVGASGVKVRCKKCGNVIIVRPPQDAEADAALRGLEESAPPTPGPEAPTGESSIFSDVDDDEIGAAFDSALGERHDEPLAPQDDEAPPPEANLPPVSDGPPRAQDWFVAVDEKQTGPLTPEAIREYWDRGEIGPDSLTWRQGFEDWVALSEVSELAAWLAPRPQRPVFSPQATSGSVPVVPVPVESAFSAGGMTRTVRAEVPTPVPDAGGWKPSASAALASLVK
ncbi:MAG: GYF domain-containing protein, partial [Myxococcaceae bacterium]